jgi:hypothetical protein
MELITFFFKLSNSLKLYHWKTGSYSRHVSSGTLFDRVIETTDTFMEIYFGKYGKGSISSVDCSADLLSDSEIISFLKEAIMFLKDLVKNGYLKESDTDLLNIRDELVGEINKTFYLFTFH